MGNIKGKKFFISPGRFEVKLERCNVKRNNYGNLPEQGTTQGLRQTFGFSFYHIINEIEFNFFFTVMHIF